MTQSKLGRLATTSILVASASLAVGTAAAEGRVGNWVMFDVPGAGGGTYPVAVNDFGVIVGQYYDANFNSHGFVRKPDGTITTIDVPGDGNQTEINDINDLGVMVGDYLDAAGNDHAFVRSVSGKITAFDDVNAVAVTVASAVNLEGVIAGRYHDVNGNAHGFVRTPNGAMQTVDGAVTPTGQTVSTGCFDINIEGQMTCKIRDDSGTWYALKWYPDGHSEVIAAPGAGTGPGVGTFDGVAKSLNDLGQSSGVDYDNNGGAHGYYRDAKGRITVYDVAGAGTDGDTGTYGGSINLFGTVVGWTYEENFASSRGYVRYHDGTLKAFTVPGAPSTGTYTQPNCVNLSGEFTGAYTDINGIAHGFIGRVAQ